MVYPKISETFLKRFTSLLILVNIIFTSTWLQVASAHLASVNQDETLLLPNTYHGNINIQSLASPSNRVEKRSLPYTDEALTRSWNIVNPSASSFVGQTSLTDTSASSSSPSSSSSSLLPHSSSLTSLNDEYETDLDSSSEPFVGDSEYKRDGSRYAFGLGKRASPESRYSFGIGKRLPEMSRYLAGSKRLPNRFQFGLGKKSRYAFGLGKRDLYEYIKRRYNFGIGKRAPSQRYTFGLG
ncbi:uncharacterized protein LOC107361300 [Tetranychus urticae]|uniref:Allatostatin A n=1 Tax=Tetranychus urticae TaxID=32264 RepID=T1K6L0_TETUR|nr:uncharacterized protein LOC107361300 [Tetranychus urticae]